MSIATIKYLYCDGGEKCPRMEEGNLPFTSDAAPNETGYMQRRDAALDGWIYRKGKDYCPECAAALPERKKI